MVLERGWRPHKGRRMRAEGAVILHRHSNSATKCVCKNGNTRALAVRAPCSGSGVPRCWSHREGVHSNDAYIRTDRRSHTLVTQAWPAAKMSPEMCRPFARGAVSVAGPLDVLQISGGGCDEPARRTESDALRSRMFG